MLDSGPRSPENTSAHDALTRSFYAELRSIAEQMLSSERAGHTLQPTAVVNEACIRLLKHGLPPIPKEQQLALAARVLKQVLIDHARARDALKRRPDPVFLALDDAEIAQPPTPVEFDRIHAVLERLRALHERHAEVLTLRVFGGMTMDQIAAVLDCSKRTIEGDWAVARAWMRRELSSFAPEADR